MAPATKKTETSAQAPAVPEPTHGGVYEVVNGQLKAIEGGPPVAPPVPALPAGPQVTGEGA